MPLLPAGLHADDRADRFGIAGSAVTGDVLASIILDETPRLDLRSRAIERF